MSLSDYRIIKIETPTFINDTKKHAMYGGLRGRKGFIERFDTYECQHFDYSETSNINTNKEQEKQQQQLLVYHDVIVGSNLCGHDGIVHGGIIAFLFDETVGWGHTIVQLRRRQQRQQQQERSRRRHSTGNIGSGNNNSAALLLEDLSSQPGVSANLNINFRVPLPANTLVRMKTYLVKTHKRKVYLRSTMESIPNERSVESSESDTEPPPSTTTTILYAEATCIMVTLTSRL